MSQSKEDCINAIEKYYGFKKELIKDVEPCGLWQVRFRVNGIKYYGSVSYYGAEPMLTIEGYVTPYYWHGTPITEEYYNNFIKGNIIRLQYLHREKEDGSWEWLNETFSTPEEAEAYISTMSNSENYSYDVYRE